MYVHVTSWSSWRRFSTTGSWKSLVDAFSKILLLPPTHYEHSV